jgi:hypothetical protein
MLCMVFFKVFTFFLFNIMIWRSPAYSRKEIFPTFYFVTFSFPYLQTLGGRDVPKTFDLYHKSNILAYIYIEFKANFWQCY